MSHSDWFKILVIEVHLFGSIIVDYASKINSTRENGECSLLRKHTRQIARQDVASLKRGLQEVFAGTL